ncbi:MAG: polysaccharide deacetylase family protein [Dysgonamonadaceae bacterium]|jgi:peptidoglycan/xylan/chitin deacetylase (PgdA/CDA1 family)|nr:polysaccharide deacetylase family protein [Dysgonamonadaceae bacterium]
MLIESPPQLYRCIFRGAHWRLNTTGKVIYLTFDDGPIPQITPWVLDLLDRYGIKATFFCIGDNVRKYPAIYHEIIMRGHGVGNHTYHHLQGLKVATETYLQDVEMAARLIDSTLFRPPHGHIRLPQFYALRRKYQMVLWDVVTRDYSYLRTAHDVINNVKQYTRSGSIIVFHDSVKAGQRMQQSLPHAIDWLLEQGYTFGLVGDALNNDNVIG